MIASIAKYHYVNLRKVCDFWMHAFFGLGPVVSRETLQLVRPDFSSAYLTRAKYSE